MVHPEQDLADRPQSPIDIYRHIAETLGNVGWCVTPDFLPSSLIADLRQEITQLWQTGQFRPAGVGRGGRFEVNPGIRSDHVLWLDNLQPTGSQCSYFDTLGQLRLAINHHLYLGLMEFEAHFAVYPAGSFYKKHLDQFRGTGARVVSAILYLNENWRHEDGGQLRLHHLPEQPERYIDIEPLGGTLVTFLSGNFPHEVLPANRPRTSITGWFKRRENY